MTLPSSFVFVRHPSGHDTGPRWHRDERKGGGYRLLCAVCCVCCSCTSTALSCKAPASLSHPTGMYTEACFVGCGCTCRPRRLVRRRQQQAPTSDANSRPQHRYLGTYVRTYDMPRHAARLILTYPPPAATDGQSKRQRHSFQSRTRTASISRWKPHLDAWSVGTIVRASQCGRLGRS
jgi:hypothetical protein